MRVVTDLAAEPGDVVVNCTGLGARELAGDDQLYAAARSDRDRRSGGVDLTISVTDDRDPDRSST